MHYKIFKGEIRFSGPSITLFHFSGRMQGSWKLGVRTLKRPITGEHRGYSRPGGERKVNNGDEEYPRERGTEVYTVGLCKGAVGAGGASEQV